MGEGEHGGGGWHENLQQTGDLVAMATNKDVCIRGKSQRSAAEGTCRSTNSNGESLGPEMRKGGVRGRNAFSLSLGVPSQSLFPSRAEPHCRRGVPVQQGDKDSLVQQLMTPLALLY